MVLQYAYWRTVVKVLRHAPGQKLVVHPHENDVWLYVLEGEMYARVGDEVVPARIIELYTPAGFELFFKDFGDRVRQGPIGLDEVNRLGEPHGIRFFDDWIPDLKATYNLRVVGE